MIKLPEPKQTGIPLDKTLRKRRSVRNFSNIPLTLDQVSNLLFAAQGITGESYFTKLRTAPSAGALYPFEVFLVVNRVKGLEQGVYHYQVSDHALERIKEGDFRSQIKSAGLRQDVLGEAGVTFVLAAVFNRTTRKYGERGYRYVYMEAGHISQNIALEAVALDLGSVTVGAFYDDQVNEIIDADGNSEAAIYLHAVGRP